MFGELYDESAAVRNQFVMADMKSGRKISDLCFSGTKEELSQTENTQLCVLACDLAASKALVEAGINAEGAAGFSLGEYAALTYAGAIANEQVYPLISARATAMQEAVPVGKGAMAAIMKLPTAEVEKLCIETDDYYVVPANYNSPMQTVISGEKEGVDAVCEKAMAAKGIATMLDVSVSSHCALMKPASEALESVLSRNGDMSSPIIPVYANSTAGIYPTGNPDAIRHILLDQLASPVRWQETIENMYDDGFDVFIECGPGTTLSGFIKRILKGKEFRTFSVQTPEDVRNIRSELR